jgi:hypothetical protein
MRDPSSKFSGVGAGAAFLHGGLMLPEVTGPALHVLLVLLGVLIMVVTGYCQ